MNFRRKINRLNRELYCEERIYFITICCYNGQKLFVDPHIINEILQELDKCCNLHGFTNCAYCFMPNHVHLLFRGKEGADLIKLIKQFKQKTGYSFRKATGKRLWQKSYYDHILRKEEDVVEVVRYILENPIRKGLSRQAEEYPFSGSLEFGKEIFKL
jgi:putative transposase